MIHSYGIDLEAGDLIAWSPCLVKLHILPDRVTVEVVDGLHIFIKIHICSEGHIRIVSRLEVGHAAGGYAKTPQH